MFLSNSVALPEHLPPQLPVSFPCFAPVPLPDTIQSIVLQVYFRVRSLLPLQVLLQADHGPHAPQVPPPTKKINSLE